MNIFRRLFNNSSKTIDETPDQLIQEEENSRIELKCIGTYNFDVVENPETFEEYQKRSGYMWEIYYSHYTMVNFKAKVGYGGNNYEIDGSFKMNAYSESHYVRLYKLIKEGEEMEEFNELLQKNIALALDKQLQENNIESIKQYLEDNEPLAFDFTFKTDKTDNMVEQRSE